MEEGQATAELKPLFTSQEEETTEREETKDQKIRRLLTQRTQQIEQNMDAQTIRDIEQNINDSQATSVFNNVGMLWKMSRYATLPEIIYDYWNCRDIETGYVTLNVTVLNGETCNISVWKRETVAYVKKKVATRLHITENGCMVVFNKTELNDDLRIEDTDLQNGSKLYLLPNKVTLKVTGLHGNACKVNTDLLKTVGDVRKEAARQMHVTEKDCIVVFDKREMNEDLQIIDTDLHDGSEICLLPHRGKVTINVKTGNGEKCTIYANYLQTFGSVRKKAARRLPIMKEHCMVEYNGKQMSEESQIIDTNIQDKSTIDLLPTRGGQVAIKVKTMNGELYEVYIDRLQTVGSLKEKAAIRLHVIEKECMVVFKKRELREDLKIADTKLQDGSEISLMPNKVTLNVTTSNGKTCVVQTNPLQPVESVKKEAARQLHLMEKGCLVVFNEKELNEDLRIFETTLQDRSEIHLLPNRGKVTIKVKNKNGKTCVVHTNRLQTIRSVKTEAAARLHLTGKDYMVVYNENELSDDLRIINTQLQDGSILCLLPNLVTLKVTVNGKTCDVDTHLLHTVGSVKTEVATRLHLTENDCIVIYNENELSDDLRIINTHLQDGSTIYLCPNRGKVTIHVSTLKGETCVVNTNVIQPIRSVIEEAARELHVTGKDCIVLYNGKNLRDDSRIIDTHLQDGSKLCLLPNKGKVAVNVMALNGETCKIYTDFSQTLGVVKKEAVRQLRITEKKYRIVLNDQELGDNLQVIEANLQNDSTVLLLPHSDKGVVATVKYIYNKARTVIENITAWFPEYFRDTTRKLTEKDLARIAQAIGENWNLLGYELGLKQVQMDHISEDSITAVGKITHMLLKWRNLNPLEATVGALDQAMKNCGEVNFDWSAIQRVFVNI